MSATLWWVTVDTFYKQMAALRSRTLVYLDDYDSANPDHVVITFDGVYDNVFEFALPVLEHFGYPFELFVIGDHIGREDVFEGMVEPPCRFADLGALDQMSRSGGRVQWHARGHGRFAELGSAGQAREFTVPDDLAARFDGHHLKWFAYPHGAAGADSRALVRERFVGAVACDEGDPADRYYLPRQLVLEHHNFFKGRVSAIIANYNYGRFLADAVDSMERQSVPPDDLLIIDDASTDESPEVLEALEGRGYRILRNTENLGIVENFRKAVSLTSGDYVFVLGADNRLRRDFILECRLALDSEERAAVAYTDTLLWGARAGQLARAVGAEKVGRSQVENWDVFRWRVPDPTPETLSRFATHNFIHGSSMYRRSFYDAVGGYRTTDGPEDHNLFYRMWGAGGRLVHVALPLLEYRLHNSSQAHTALGLEMENRTLRERVSVLMRECEAVRKEGLRKLEAERGLTLSLTGSTGQLVAHLADAARELGALRASLDAANASKRLMNEEVRWLEQRSLPVSPLRAVLSVLQRLVGLGPRRPLTLSARQLAMAEAIFDPDWYAEHNRGTTSSAKAWRHFTDRGLAEGHDPSPLFDGAWYLATYPDVAAGGVAAFVHYLKYGAAENRSPGPLFDARWYLQANADVAAVGADPLTHYIAHGVRESRDPHPLFFARWYRETYLGSDATRSPLRDFRDTGYRAGRDPNPLFDSAWYLASYPEVAHAGLDPFLDYMREGARSGREPNPAFQTPWYLARHPEAANGQTPLAHALRSAPEDIAPDFDAAFYRAQTGFKDKNAAECLAHYLRSRPEGIVLSIADVDQARLDNALGTTLTLAPQHVAVGIVLFNEDPAELEQVLASIRDALRRCGQSVEGRILVFDNSDEPCVLAPSADLTYLRRGPNLGFGGGHNELCEAAFDGPAEVYIGINSDGCLHRDAIAAMLRMHAAQSGRALIEALQFPEEHPKIYNPQTLETPWISCSCYLIPRAIHDAIGGFDKNIFLYCEDVDLSWSARRSGFRTMMCPAAVFFHDVSDRGHQAWRYREMLVSARYLGHKWGSPRFQQWAEGELIGQSFAASCDELPPLDGLPTAPHGAAVADFEHGLSFAPVRW